MRHLTTLTTSIALLTALPVALTALHKHTPLHNRHAPQTMAVPVLASLGVAIPDHNTHGAGCGCAACQACTVADPTTI